MKSTMPALFSVGRAPATLLCAVVAMFCTSAIADGPEDAVEGDSAADPPAVDVPTLPPAPAQELRGVWIHTYAPQDWDEICIRLRDHGFNAVFARIGRGGNVIYESDYLPKDKWAREAGVDELDRVCTAAHKAGLQLHAWRVNYHMGSAPSWYRDRLEAEGRISKDPEGKSARFANPGDPRNALLEYRVMMEMVDKYPIDGLHLDYIRYTEVPSYDFDYSDVSRREFERLIRRPVRYWPLDVRFGTLRMAYDNWMRSNIDGLVQRTAAGVRQRRPDVMLSAAVWPRHRRYWTLIKQDWPKWVEEGWLDFVVPMDYSGDDDRFESLVKEQVGVVSGNRPIAIGIGGWLLKSPEQLLRQIATTRRYGTAGFVLFSYLSEQIQEQLEAVRDHVATEPAAAMGNDVLLEVRVADAVARRDRPHAVRAGAPAHALVGVSVRPGLADEVVSVEADVYWVDPATGEKQALGNAQGRGRAGWRGVVTPAAGLAQPWAHAKLRMRDGTVRESWRRGPLFEGMEAAEYAEWAGRDLPPRVDEGSGVRVGVFQPGLGAEKWVEVFEDDPELNVFLLHRLRADHLAACEVLVVPQLADASHLNSDAFDTVRAWVRRGGKLVLLHDAVGFRLHPPLFAEVARGDERVESRDLALASSLAEALGADRVQHAYDDHLTLVPGDVPADVLATNEDGRPVILRAKWGRGVVLMVGTIFGHPQDREISSDEIALVHRLVAGL